MHGTANADAVVQEEDERWFAYSSGWYAREPVPTSCTTLPTQEQLDLLDSHPLFTGCCPHCSWEVDRSSPPDIHWDGPDCGWKDDSV